MEKIEERLENVKQQILWYNKVHRHDESKLNIANAALMLIADISLGYDSYNSLNDLKYLVDELRMIAVAGLNMTYGKEDPNGTIRI